MSDRFDPRPVLGASFGAVRRRTHVGGEPRDWVALGALIGLPAVAAVASFWLGVQITRPDPLIAGVSLLAASLVAVFVQLAAWRSKLTDRAKAAERPARSAIDEAVGHTLVSAVVSLLLAGMMAVLSNVLPTDGVEPSRLVFWAARGLSALAIGLAVYLMTAFILVVNLLWDAYERDSATPSKQRDAQPQQSTGTSR